MPGTFFPSRILLRRRFLRLPLTALLSLVIAGCAATQVSDKAIDGRDWSSIKSLSGKLAYLGDPAYLPRFISAATPDRSLGRGSILISSSFRVMGKFAVDVQNPYT